MSIFIINLFPNFVPHSHFLLYAVRRPSNLQPDFSLVEVGIYKRKQDSKKTRKKERKQELGQELSFVRRLVGGRSDGRLFCLS